MEGCKIDERMCQSIADYGDNTDRKSDLAICKKGAWTLELIP